MRLAMCFLLVFLLVVPAVAFAGSEQVQPGVSESVQGTGGTGQDVQKVPYGGIRPVSPDEFTSRVNRMVLALNEAIGGLIVPVATFSFLVSVAALALGAIIGSKYVSRFGWGGLFLTCAGLIIFWGIPIILGLIKSLADSFSG